VLLKYENPTVIAILLGILGISDPNLSRDADYSDRCLSCLFQYPKAIAVILSQIMPRKLPSTFLSIYYSPIILLLDEM
jgi:hypothetical protein